MSALGTTTGFAQQRMTPEDNSPGPEEQTPTPPYIPPAHSPRKPIRFSFEERKAMHPFRAQYKATNEADVRHRLLIHHIFPAIFEFWRKQGDEPRTEPEFRIRWWVCCAGTLSNDMLMTTSLSWWLNTAGTIGERAKTHV